MSAYQKSVWLGDLMRYRNLEKLGVGIRADPSTVSVAVPQTTETVGIGRAKRISRDWWLFESESGEYGLVATKDTVKWILD